MGVSEKRLLGWEPRVTTRGYNQDGDRVPVAEAWETVAQTETEWDDQQRESMAGLVIFEAGIHACGFHTSLTTDRENHFAVEEDECLVCAAMDRFERIRGEADRQVLERLGGDKAPAALARPSDGRMTYIKPKTSPAVEAMLASLDVPPPPPA